MYFFKEMDHVEGIKGTVGVLVASSILLTDQLRDFEVRRVGKSKRM